METEVTFSFWQLSKPETANIGSLSPDNGNQEKYAKPGGRGERVKIGDKEQMVFSTEFPPSFLSFLHPLIHSSKCTHALHELPAACQY